MSNYYDELSKLVQLLSESKITNEEFAERKSKLSSDSENISQESKKTNEDLPSESDGDLEHGANVTYAENDFLFNEIQNLRKEVDALKSKSGMATTTAWWGIGIAILSIILSVVIPGPEGPMGPQGIQGMEGAQGIQGPAGRTPSCSDVKVITKIDAYYYYYDYVSKCS